MYYAFKSNKIYPVIKAGKKYLKKVDHFAPVSPTYLPDQFFTVCYSDKHLSNLFMRMRRSNRSILFGSRSIDEACIGFKGYRVLLPGIKDTISKEHVYIASRYYPFYFQGYRILCSIAGIQGYFFAGFIFQNKTKYRVKIKHHQ